MKKLSRAQAVYLFILAVIFLAFVIIVAGTRSQVVTLPPVVNCATNSTTDCQLVERQATKTGWFILLVEEIKGK